MKFEPGWSSHYPVLVKVLQQAKGDVLELGMGPFSTPLIHWLCHDKDLRIFSFDNDPKYWELNKLFATTNPFHMITLVNNWDDIWDITNFLNLVGHKFSVAFIDHKPAKRRHKDILKLVNLADIIVIHDTEPEHDKFYGYEKRVYPKFKYRFNYIKAYPHTTVLSNVNDLSFLKNEI